MSGVRDLVYWLGPLGDLRALPPIERDTTPTTPAVAVEGVFRSLTGARSRDRLGRARRDYGLSWRYLPLADYELLEAMAAGELGGPLRLIDPTRPNLLAAQLATTGTESRTVRGWSATNGARVFVLPGDRPVGVEARGGIAWTKPTVADELATGRDLPELRVPTPPGGGEVSCAAWARRTDASAAVQIAPSLDLWTASGVQRLRAAPRTPVGGAWTELRWTLATRADEVSCAPSWRQEAGTAATVQIVGLRAGHGAVAPDASRGGGAPEVAIAALTQTVHDVDECSYELTLEET